MQYELVIFDLDGTILDTLEDLKNSVNAALQKNKMPLRTTEEVRQFVGNGIRKLIERAVPAGLAVTEIDKVHRDFTEHYMVHCADNTKPYTGIPECMQALKTAGVQIAVVSNKADPAVKALCERYFPGMLDIAIGERAGVQKKPAPDSVNAVLAELGVSVQKAVYVGDSEVDIQTAKNAGMDCISVTWGFRPADFLKAEGAGCLVDTVAALMESL